MEIAFPKRASDLIDIDDETCTKLTIDIFTTEPSISLPMQDTVDPNLVKLLIERQDPSWTKSYTDVAFESEWKMFLKDRLDPRWT
jgi:hypothetical protein